ncbi:DUF3037 domain-containing protein [Pedobacter arcticus]|uniref:DUF3037 domain-containing protein n=1 Tax=Pedobacter arcticus TaxID=752140 RepID=UPI0002EF068A|nr:DUF3037 domain-containing protein [Pedobacter arcticus]
MQEQHLFEYAIIRVVPRVEREEFINVGVILFCKQQHFLKGKFFLDKSKLLALSPDLDIEELEKNLDAFTAICNGKNIGSVIADLDLPSRFRWLTATRSTVIQTSKVHPGFCADANTKLESIFSQMVS